MGTEERGAVMVAAWIWLAVETKARGFNRLGCGLWEDQIGALLVFFVVGMSGPGRKKTLCASEIFFFFWKRMRK